MIVFYTDYLTRWMLGEFAAGLALGSLVVIGAFFVQTGTFTPGIIYASIPPGLLTSLLLFLNEFPDVEADRLGGRKHMVIVLGKKSASFVYAALMLAVYLVLILSVATGKIPVAELLGLLTFPVAAMAAYRAIHYHDDLEKLVPALGMNVVVVLATDFLMALGFVIG